MRVHDRYCSVQSRGAKHLCFAPPTPPDPPKVFEPIFLQFEILGEGVGAKGAEIFFFALP